jgi:Xaa-Pro dipeptidase
MKDSKNKEIHIKHNRIVQLLESSDLDGLLLAKHSSFKWFTCGGTNDVIKNDDTSLLYLFITPTKRYLIATRSDADRVMEEELKDLDFEPVLYDWYNQSFNDVLKDLGIKNAGADIIGEGLKFLGTEISLVRTVLTDYEIDRYKKMCQEYKTILTDYCLGLKPGITEIDAAAGLAYECGKKGIRLPVLMVGSDDRIFAYRHPCATGKKIEKYVLFATVAEREGICANVTRSMYFGKAPDELKEKQDAVNQVEATYQFFSKPGISLGELFEEGKKAYEEAGYPGEWKNHLQGGISGYAPLEFLTLENSGVTVRENNIMGWNPTIQGTKSEDPILITRTKPVQFTIDSRWPYKNYTAGGKRFVRPLIMEL